MTRSARVQPVPEAVSPMQMVFRVVLFGILVVGAVAAVIVAGEWWIAGIGLVGKAAAAVGLIVSVLALTSDRHATSWWSSLATAITLATVAIVAVAVALALG